MEDIFVSGGNRYVRDSGPNGFSMRFPGGAADPTPTLTGELSFDGGDYLYYDGDLTRFYAKMPPNECTFLVSTSLNSVTGGTQRVFSCETATRGIAFALVTTAPVDRSWIVSGTGAGLRVYQTNAATTPLGRALQIATYETTPRVLVNQAVIGGAWAAGAYGTTVYDAATVPRIGSQPAAAGFVVGRIGYACCIRGAISSPDMAQLSALIANGVKPWCVRR
jgi:hypothetical protein